MQSALWAAELGLPYAFADFISATGAPAAAEYRSRFEPSPGLAEPYVLLAVSAICAETDEEAQHLAASVTMAMRMLRRGRPIPLPDPDTAAAWLAQERARPRAPRPPGRPRTRRMITGSPATVRAGIEEAVAEYGGADEVMVVTITHSPEARRRSYELIAGEFALNVDTPVVTLRRGG
jgi:alkanesulfonate monooxygenase SsuD/methylene tetrahydromethanopterin reductase-like flavin-dependent oxidoreductase (luciferase family)